MTLRFSLLSASSRGPLCISHAISFIHWPASSDSAVCASHSSCFLSFIKAPFDSRNSLGLFLVQSFYWISERFSGATHWGGNTLEISCWPG